MDDLDKLVQSVKNVSEVKGRKKETFIELLNMKQRENLENYRKEFYNTPEKYLPIDELGDLYIQWFYNRYAAIRMLKNMPIFERAYNLLTERKNYSRRNAFGEMHGDGYLWIERHPKIKVMVEERQSYRFIFISQPGFSFHIRELQYKYNYPQYRRHQLKGITINKFKKQGFKPYCPRDYDEKRFNGFTYGDNRDEGYILSMRFMIDGMETSEYADRHSLYAIDSLKYWEPYLDNPTELE